MSTGTASVAGEPRNEQEARWYSTVNGRPTTAFSGRTRVSRPVLKSGTGCATRRAADASVVTMLASRRLLRCVRQKLRDREGGVPEGRWAAVFASVASQILDLLLAPAKIARATARCLKAMLLHEAVDPSVSRQLLMARVQNGVSC